MSREDNEYEFVSRVEDVRALRGARRITSKRRTRTGRVVHEGDTAAEVAMCSRLHAYDAAFRRARPAARERRESGSRRHTVARVASTGSGGRTASHGQQAGQTTSKAQQPASGDDPPGEHGEGEVPPAPSLSGPRLLRLRDKATAIAFRFAVEKSLTAKEFSSMTRGLTADERERVEGFLPSDARAELAADRAGVA